MRTDRVCILCGFETPAVEPLVECKSQGQWFNRPGCVSFADDEAVDAYLDEIMLDHFHDHHPGVDINWTDEEYAAYLAGLEAGVAILTEEE